MSKCKHKWSKPTIDTEVISGKESGIVPYEDVYKRSYVSCEKCGAVKEKFLGRNRIGGYASLKNTNPLTGEGK